MGNNSYAPHYAISRYSIREFKTGAEPFMVAMIIIYYYYRVKQSITCEWTYGWILHNPRWKLITSDSQYK